MKSNPGHRGIIWAPAPGEPHGANLTERQIGELLGFIQRTAEEMLAERRAPIPLYDFVRRVGDKGGPLPTDFGSLCDAVKSLLVEIDRPSVRLLSPSRMRGVGYVYDETNPDTLPVRAASRFAF